MNEKILNVVIEALGSDTVKQSIDKMLEDQTQNIVEQISTIVAKENSTTEIELEKYKFLFNDAEKKKKDLESKFDELRQEKDELAAEYENIEANLKNTEESMAKIEADFKSLNNRLNNYKTIIEAYEAFSSLSGQTKERLKNIFVSSSLACFISACFEWDNVEGVWNYIKRGIIEKSNIETDNLILIFHFMFAGYNAKFHEPQYILITPIIGTKHNSEEQVILGTKTDGILSKVCLEGYKNSKGRVINKALVEV